MSREEARKYPRVHNKLVKGPQWFNCSCCGVRHTLGVYVAAHTNVRLHKSCECGAEYSVLRYEVVLEKPSPRENA